jgi:hypothetical protein
LVSINVDRVNYQVKQPSIIHCDNQSAINMAQNYSEHDRSKHIRIKYDYIKDEIDNKYIHLSWISSNNQLADIFTKALQGSVFLGMKNKLISKIQQ